MGSLARDDPTAAARPEDDDSFEISRARHDAVDVHALEDFSPSRERQAPSLATRRLAVPSDEDEDEDEEDEEGDD